MGSKAGSASKVRLNSFDDLFGGAENTSGEQIIVAHAAPFTPHSHTKIKIGSRIIFVMHPINRPTILTFGLPSARIGLPNAEQIIEKGNPSTIILP